MCKVVFVLARLLNMIRRSQSTEHIFLFTGANGRAAANDRYFFQGLDSDFWRGTLSSVLAVYLFGTSHVLASAV